jgi:hypothetical protein
MLSLLVRSAKQREGRAVMLLEEIKPASIMGKARVKGRGQDEPKGREMEPALMARAKGKAGPRCRQERVQERALERAHKKTGGPT